MVLVEQTLNSKLYICRIPKFFIYFIITICIYKYFSRSMFIITSVALSAIRA